MGICNKKINAGRSLFKMCEQQKPSIKDFFSNLKVPMTLSRKISLFLRNNAIKLVKRQNCCGHTDEPGC